MIKGSTHLYNSHFAEYTGFDCTIDEEFRTVNCRFTINTFTEILTINSYLEKMYLI